MQSAAAEIAAAIILTTNEMCAGGEPPGASNEVDTTHESQDPSVWLAADLGTTRSWVRRLTPECQDEIEAGVRKAVAAGKSYTDVGLADFPLPKTRSLLREVFNDLEDGAGFSVVGDFPVDRFTYEENLIGYAGVSAHLGTLVDQSYAGAMKADVKDMGLAYGKDVRGYHSSAMLRFHTDGAVLTGLLCLQSAVEGGLSVLASSGALSNRIIEERPDLHAILVRAFTITGAESTPRATIPCRLRLFQSSRSTTACSTAPTIATSRCGPPRKALCFRRSRSRRWITWTP